MNNIHMQHKITQVWWLLKATYGSLFIIAGADKFINMVAAWQEFISPTVRSFIPVDPAMFIQMVGAWEIILGFMIISAWTKLGARLAAVWLLIITANLLTMGFPMDRAARDVIMAVGGVALYMLTTIKEDLASNTN